MINTVDVHSRSRIAGYEPQRLQEGRVYVAGLGALGQNLVFDLALSGVGQLRLAERDVSHSSVEVHRWDASVGERLRPDLRPRMQ